MAVLYLISELRWVPWKENWDSPASCSSSEGAADLDLGVFPVGQGPTVTGCTWEAVIL